MGENNISRLTYPFCNSARGDRVYLRSRIEKNATFTHVSGTNERDATIDKFIWTGSVLPMISVLNEEDTSSLKLKNRWPILLSHRR